jgi:hypothetical protein
VELGNDREGSHATWPECPASIWYETADGVEAAELRVNVVVPDIAPDVAVITEEPNPEPTDVANPLLLIPATVVVSEPHVTLPLTSCVVPSE